MGKKSKDLSKEEDVRESIDESIEERTEEQPKTDNVTPIKSGSIVLEKYFQLYAPDVHSYTKAYLVERYKGVRKNPEDWTQELKETLNNKE